MEYLAYQTHEPVLRFLLENCEIKTVLEFGMGNSSTPLFLDNNVNLTSVETNDNWFFKIKESHKINRPILCERGKCHKHLEDDSWYDLIFVDGMAEERIPCCNASMGKCDYLVIHDSDDQLTYNWHQMKIPDDFLLLTYKELSPWTSIIVHKTIAEQLINRNILKFSVNSSSNPDINQKIKLIKK